MGIVFADREDEFIAFKEGQPADNSLGDGETS